MADTPEVRFIEPYAGLRYPERVLSVEAAEQDQLLTICGIDPAIYQGMIDPVVFITMAIREGVRNGVSSNGAVNMQQKLIQHRPMRLGEPLTVNGGILGVEAVPRGTVATSECWFSGADGERALSSFRKSLRPDPAKAAVRGTGSKPEPVIKTLEGLKEVARFTLTPEQVTAFSKPGNALHFDPEVARRSGYRAPIMGGSQSVRYLSAEIWRHFRPRILDVEIYFLRPIFWDERFSVMVEETNDRWQAICLAKDNKVMVEARINRIET